MGIYDRDYYREEKKEEKISEKILKNSYYLVGFLILIALIIYLLAIASE